MTTHPNRSKSASIGDSFVIMLPAVNRLWKHPGAAQEALFTSEYNARRVIERLSGRGALAGAKIMRITNSDEPGARWHDGRWLIDV